MSKAVREEIRSALAAKGRLVAFCCRESLAEAERELAAKRADGQVAEELFDRYLGHFVFEPPQELPAARSVLIVASPIGRSVIELETEAGRVEAAIPPTYGPDELYAENEALIAPILERAGSRFVHARLPLKNLAARSGLGRYGRDNILRFPSAGSYVRLDGWWTELSAEGERWGEPQALERCAGCGACAAACPGGCFVEGHFLIDARRCLTFMNEGDGDFPVGLDPRAHNAAVGCLRCQDACPENRDVEGRKVYRRFVLSREESEAILAGRSMPGAKVLAAAIEAAEMGGSEARLGRNLRALIAAQAARGAAGR
jgi:epoxyqueuosine reductase